MNNKDVISISKFLSLVLRHAPETIGLQLDAQGWADIAELIQKANAQGMPLDTVLIAQIVATSDKKRFALSEDGRRIRANQGHSVASVDLQLSPIEPPELLYHGTATRFLDSIRAQGLLPGSRNHVHLSTDQETATKVGARHGSPLVLSIQAMAMHKQGHVFYRSENGVWLTNQVPIEFIDFHS